MTEVFIAGCGAVSPAGWDVAALRDALAKGELLPHTEIAHPGAGRPLRVMRVPPPSPRPPLLAHARLRRTSPITQFAVAAAVEALGPREPGAAENVGVIVCVFSGCVNYSRRFYDETLKDPATASPLVFPETVFNAPASHISAYIGSTAINYTLVGDAGTFLVGLATGARWLLEGRVEECLVVGTEEIDWITAEAARLFDRSKYLSEGAGAVLLKKKGRVRIENITDEFLYNPGGKVRALERMCGELRGLSQFSGVSGRGDGRAAALPYLAEREVCGKECAEGAAEDVLLVESTSNETGISREEARLWSNWDGPRISPKKILGEGLMAATAWEVVAAADALEHGIGREAIIEPGPKSLQIVGADVRRLSSVGQTRFESKSLLTSAPTILGVGPSSIISVAGFHQHAIGARLRIAGDA